MLAQKVVALVFVDNVFASPLYQKPLELGADILIYSTTEQTYGYAHLLGGAVLGKRSFVDNVFLLFYRQTGAAISVFYAW